MRNPTIHVIIPVYNAGGYLNEAVDSVLSQPYQNLALYLIDDGSCDGSAALCDDLAAQHHNIHVFHQPNGGVSAARNAGIRIVLETASDDDYLFFCDADDRWMTNAICESLFDGEQYDIHVFGAYGANQNMERFYRDIEYEDYEETEIERIIWDNGPLCASFYSCSMIRSNHIRFSQVTKYAEDIMFIAQCRHSSHSVYFHRECLYLYRHNANSAMHHARRRLSKIDYYSQIINGWIETEKKINAHADRTGRTTDMGRTLAAIYFLDMATMHYRNFGSRKKLENAFRAHPDFHLFENMDPKTVSVRQYRDHLMLKEHPALFQMKNYFIGIFAFAMETAYRLPPVKAIYIRRKYRLTALPENRRDQ